MATYKQVDIVTESKQRGGKRENSGAKLKHGEPTKTIRLPISLVDKINQGLIDIVTLSKVKASDDIVTDSKSKEIDKLNCMAHNCFVCTRWTGESCEFGLTLEGFVCNDFEHWRVVNNDNLNRIEELKVINKRLQNELNRRVKNG